MTEEHLEIEESERHPFRFLLKLAVFVGLLYAAGRFLAQKKDEYAGLTESQARDKFMEKVGPRIGEENATEIADQVIPKLKESGLIKSDPTDSGDQDSDEDADKVSEAVDSVVKD